MVTMDCIALEKILIRGVIGVNEWERKLEQDILVSLKLFLDLKPAGISDKIDDTLNYRALKLEIIRGVQNAKRFTLEALAADIARMCLKHGKVERVRVKVEKPGALRFTQSAYIEIERIPGDFND